MVSQYSFVAFTPLASVSGPCPPPGHGTHHYYFQLSALDAPIDLPAGASIDELHQAARGRLLEEVTLVGTYQR